MNLKLIETLLIALIPLFATTTAAHVAAEGAVRPELEVEGKIRGSDNKGADRDFLTDLLEKDKPNLLKGADGGLTANHAHDRRMLGKEPDGGGAFVIGAGGMAGDIVDNILEKAGVTIDTCGTTPLADADTQKIKCLIGTAGYAAMTALCNHGVVTRLCMLDGLVAIRSPLSDEQQAELFKSAKEIWLGNVPPHANENLFTASSTADTTTFTLSLRCKQEILNMLECAFWFGSNTCHYNLFPCFQ